MHRVVLDFAIWREVIRAWSRVTKGTHRLQRYTYPGAVGSTQDLRSLSECEQLCQENEVGIWIASTLKY